MDYRQMVYLQKIVECGSMCAAARHLGIAQPSLSQQVRKLETALGVELLIRTPRGVRPTEAGHRLSEHAVAIMARMDAARGDVVSLGSQPGGRVVFGMPASVSMALSIPMAETIRLELPNLRFCATEAMSGHIKEWVLAGEVDLAILYDQHGVGECVSELILEEDLWIYSSFDNWPFSVPPGAPIELAEVVKADLVLPSARHGLRTFLDRHARSARLSFAIATEMDSLPQIKALVARGSGQTILSPAAVHDLVGSGHLVGSPIASPRLRRPVYLIQSAGSGVSAGSRAVERICREVVRDLVYRGIWQADLPAR